MKAADRLLKQAEELAQISKSWADFSNALFDPVQGLIARAYPVGPERTAFMKTQQYTKIRQLLADSIASHGLVEGANPTTSRFDESSL